MSFTAKSGPKGSVVVRIWLDDAETGVGLDGRTVHVSVTGQPAADVTTDEDGQAKLTLKVAHPKGKTFTVEFETDGYYDGATAQAVYGKKGASGSST
jgi:hypothetical protein